jgi:acetyl-CoA acetyltransferase
MAMFAHRLAAEYGGVVIKTVMEKMAAISVDNFRKFVTGAVSELLGNIVANELLKTLGFEEPYKWADICADAVLAGMKNVVIPVVSDDASKILKRLNLVYRGLGDCVIGTVLPLV